MWGEFFGTMTMICGILMVFIGLTSQAVKNHKESRCGNPLSLAILAALVYLFRAAYAITIDSYYILIPDLIGILVSGVIIFQFFYYRKPSSS